MSNWWAQRLNQGQAPTQYVPAPVPRHPMQTNTVTSPVQQPTKLPQSAKDTSLCPDCGSSNYMAAQGSQYYRCLECGYPIVQSGSGMGRVHSDAPVRKSVQVPTEGYQPTRIIGRVE